MKISFKVIFMMVASMVVGYALHDFKHTGHRMAQEAKKDSVLPELTIENVSSVKIFRPMGDLHLVREGIEWRILQPLQDHASPEAAENFVIAIANLKIQMVDTSEAVHWADYGLNIPETKFEIEYAVGGENKKIFIELGSVRTVEGGYYLRLNGNSALYASSADWTPLAFILANDLREKHVFVWDGQIIDVKFDSSSSWQLTYSGNEWKRTPPLAKNQTLNLKAVGDYMKSIRDIEADQILEKPGAKPLRAVKPLFTLSIKTDKSTEWQPYKLTESGKVYHFHPPHRDYILEISKEKLASLHKDAAYFINQPEK